jgi:hypothetical protein
MSLVPVATMISRVSARVGQGYCYGMYFSSLVDQNAIDAKEDQYPTKYNASLTYNGQTKLAKVWAQDWIDEYAGDCSGLIKAAYWTDENGDVIYKYLGRADTSANGMWNMSASKGPISTMPDTPGLGVYKYGHVGVYVGNDTVVEARYWYYGVIESVLEPGGANPRNWTGWFEIPYVDYGSTPEPPEVPDVYNHNLVDEGLELGDLIANSEPYDSPMDELCMLLITVTDDAGVSGSGMYSGLPSPYLMYGSTDHAEMLGLINDFDTYAKSILSVFLCPSVFVNGIDDTAQLINDYDVTGKIAFVLDPRPGSLDGYTPKNSKLLYYPFQYLLAHTNDGQRAVFRYEDFNGPPAFEVYAAVIPGGVAKLVPMNKIRAGEISYEDFDHALNLPAFPECIWNINEYQRWQSIHGASEAIGTAAAVAPAVGGIIAGFATGNPLMVAGSLGAGSFSVMQALSKRSEAEKMGFSSHGSQSGQQTLAANGKNIFTLVTKSIKYMQAKRIDDYFEMYGYKTNELKVPDLGSRTYWNYIKTIGANLAGPIPADDLQKLAALFDNGITIWHDPDHFGDYTQDNHSY